MIIRPLNKTYLRFTLIVAPIVIILFYLVIDFFYGESPSTNQHFSHYSLSPRSNCHYSQGICSLANGDFRLELRTQETTANTTKLYLFSPYTIEHVDLSLTPINTIETTRISMQAHNSNLTIWQATLPSIEDINRSFHLRIQSNGATYFAAIPIRFLPTQTLIAQTKKAQPNALF